MLRDPYSAKPYVLFYTTKRVGGGVQDFDAIKLLKFAHGVDGWSGCAQVIPGQPRLWVSASRTRRSATARRPRDSAVA